MRIAREGIPFVLPISVATIYLARKGYKKSAFGTGFLAAFTAFFFRVPDRVFVGSPDIIISPADGKVISIDSVEDYELGDNRWQRISIFLSVFDVHVQWVPVAGVVTKTIFRKGSKKVAFCKDASESNEQLLTVIKRFDGKDVVVRQVVGLVARRIVGYLAPEMPVARGELLGIIKFGSRVDIYLPPSDKVLVRKGDKLKGGLSPVALVG